MNLPTHRVFPLPILVGALLGTVTPGCRCAHGNDPKSPTASDDREESPAPGDTGAWERGKLPPSVTEGEPTRGGEVVVHVSSEPPSLNLITHSDAWAKRLVAHHIQESLVGMDPYDDPDYGHVPELAERWDVSEDHLVYTFHLRRGVTWHDGKPFTARDVIATFDKVRDPAVRSAHLKSYLQELEGYEALDDHTVRFTWKRPYFLAIEDPFYSFPIQPAHILEKLSGAEYNEAATNPLQRAPLGTGPFKFVEWVSGQKIVFVRNEAYWGDEPYLDRIVFRIVEELPIALQLAQREELHVVSRVQPDAWASMNHRTLREKYHRLKLFTNNYAWIGWNQERPFFADAKVRRALTMLIDRPGIIEHIRHGLDRPAHCHFYHASEACDFEHEPLPFDPARAVKLLEEAGWKDTNGNGVRDKDGREFEFVFMVPASADWAARLGTKMKEDFRRAGLSIELQRVKWSSYLERLRSHEFDACTLLWSNTSPRQDPTQIWHSSSIDDGSNFISFRNERADQLIEQARVTFDPTERNRLFQDFGKLLWKEQPYTFLWTRPELHLFHERIKGVRPSLNHYQYEDWWVEDAKGGAAPARQARSGN